MNLPDEAADAVANRQERGHLASIVLVAAVTVAALLGLFFGMRAIDNHFDQIEQRQADDRSRQEWEREWQEFERAEQAVKEYTERKESEKK